MKSAEELHKNSHRVKVCGIGDGLSLVNRHLHSPGGERVAAHPYPSGSIEKDSASL